MLDRPAGRKAGGRHSVDRHHAVPTHARAHVGRGFLVGQARAPLRGFHRERRMYERNPPDVFFSCFPRANRHAGTELGYILVVGVNKRKKNRIIII